MRQEHERLGHAGRFGPGLPRVSDGSLLFLLHLIEKMREPEKGGGRVAIVLNGSPLFTGGAGSGESEIRKWVMEQDLLEAIIALPTDMFYNTGLSTFIWILSNHKSLERKGKVQLVNGVEFYQKMRKNLGSKRKELGQDDIDRIMKLYGDFKNSTYSKIFEIKDFGYSAITVERPLRNDNGEIILGAKGKQRGKPLPNPELRDIEIIPLVEDINEYFLREVLPHAPDAWIDNEKIKIGYEIPFTRHFYKYVPPRQLNEIDSDLKVVTSEIEALLREITE